jgi:hypothetical protein
MWNWVKLLDRLLRGELTSAAALQSRGLDVPVLGIAVMIDLLGMAYGLCMGLFAVTGSGSGAAMQIPASMLKVPGVFLLTLLVTLPSLYVFNTLVGSRLSFIGTTRLLLSSLAVMLAVLASAGPIVAFFSVSTTSYEFMILLNVIVFSIAGFLGLGFLLQTLHRMSIAETRVAANVSEIADAAPADDAQTPQPLASPPLPVLPDHLSPLEKLKGHLLSGEVRNVFRIWLVVFALVGAQMGWVLRPFIGAPGQPFSWLRPKQSNFFMAVASDLQRLAVGGSDSR